MTKQNLVYAILGKQISGFTRLEIYTPNKDQRVTFYLSADDATMIIGFYGTTNQLSDWWNNFLIEFKNLTCGSKTYKSGSGWVNEAVALLVKCKQMIATHGPSKIYVTGHSQGGVHATLTVADFAETYPTKSIFGSSFNAPMPFDKASSTLFATTINSKPNVTFDRWIVPGDPVSLLPGNFFGFFHSLTAKKLEKVDRWIPDQKYHQLDYVLKVI